MVGNPRFLDVVLKCISKREEIFGYGAPSKRAIDSTVHIDNLTEEQADRILEEILAKHELNGQ